MLCHRSAFAAGKGQVVVVPLRPPGVILALSSSPFFHAHVWPVVLVIVIRAPSGRFVALGDVHRIASITTTTVIIVAIVVIGCATSLLAPTFLVLVLVVRILRLLLLPENPVLSQQHVNKP